MAKLAWVKTVSRYNYCIVTEAARMVLVRIVSQYNMLYCDWGLVGWAEGSVTIKSLYRD